MGPRFVLELEFAVWAEVELDVEVGGPGSETGLRFDVGVCHQAPPIIVELPIDGVSEVICPEIG
jgi:hypothetical protein